MSPRPTFALALLGAALASCSFDAHRQGELCNVESDCRPGQVCAVGLCVPAARSDALVGQNGDGGGRADGAPPTQDAGADQQAMDQRVVDRSLPALDAEADQAAPDRAPADLAPPPPDRSLPGMLPLPERDPLDERLCPPANRRCFLVAEDGHLDEDDEEEEFLADPELKVRQRHNRRRWVVLRFDLERLRDRRPPLRCELVLRRADDSHQHAVPPLALFRLAQWPAFVSWDRPARTVGPDIPIPSVPERGTALPVDVSTFIPSVLVEDPLELSLLLRVATASWGEVEFDSLETPGEAAQAPYLDCLFPADQ